MGLLGFKDGSKKEKAVKMLMEGATREEILKATGMSKNTFFRLLNSFRHRDDVQLERRVVYYLKSVPPKAGSAARRT